jgi:VWFA-related protein
MRSICFFGLAMASPFLLLAPGILAQEKTFFDAVEVKVASVEVVVEDKDGQKISGLTADDFQVFEDGKLQDITYFTAQKNGETVVSRDGEADLGAPAAPLTERVHLAIFVDEVHLSPQNRNQVFARLKEYLGGSLQPTDLVLVARLADRLVIEQPFTADVAALAATLDRLAKSTGAAMQIEANYRRILREVTTTPLAVSAPTPEVTGPVALEKISQQEISQVQARSQAMEIITFSEERRIRVLATIKALETAIGSLAGMPGRKALIYLSDGLPVRAAAGLSDAWLSKYEAWATKIGDRSLLAEMTRNTAGSIESQAQLDQLAQRASAAKVAFYVLSPGSKATRGLSGAELAGTSFGGSSQISTAAITESFESESPLQQLADQTGGKALFRNMDIARLLGNVRDDFGTFYSLGYQPQAEAKDGNRKIAVKVKNRPDAKVRYTHVLGDHDPVDQLRELTLSALYHGLTDNPLQIALDPKPDPADLGGDRFRVDLMVKVPFEKILLVPQDENHVGRLTLFVVVQDHKNQHLSNINRVEVPIKIPNDQLLQVMAQKAALPLKLEMQGGPQRLAIGMRDHLARVTSTIEVDFEVPNSMAAATPEPPETPMGNADGPNGAG